MFSRAIMSALVDNCEKQVAIKVAKTASAVLPKPSFTDEEKRIHTGAFWDPDGPSHP